MNKSFDDRSVSDRLLAARKAKRLTQTELRDATGLAISIISRIENNCSNVTLSNFYAYCSAVDVDVDYIFTGERKAK